MSRRITALVSILSISVLTACGQQHSLPAGFGSKPQSVSPKSVSVFANTSELLERRIDEAQKLGLDPKFLMVASGPRRYFFNVYSQALHSQRAVIVRAYGRIYVFAADRVTIAYGTEPIALTDLPSVRAVQIDAALASGKQPGDFKYGDTARKLALCPVCVELITSRPTVTALSSAWNGILDEWQVSPDYAPWAPQPRGRTLASVRTASYCTGCSWSAGGGGSTPAPQPGSGSGGYSYGTGGFSYNPTGDGPSGTGGTGGTGGGPTGGATFLPASQLTTALGRELSGAMQVSASTADADLQAANPSLVGPMFSSAQNVYKFTWGTNSNTFTGINQLIKLSGSQAGAAQGQFFTTISDLFNTDGTMKTLSQIQSELGIPETAAESTWVGVGPQFASNAELFLGEAAANDGFAPGSAGGGLQVASPATVITSSQSLWATFVEWVQANLPEWEAAGPITMSKRASLPKAFRAALPVKTKHSAKQHVNATVHQR